MKRNFFNFIPIVQYNIQNNVTEQQLNDIFMANDLSDFLMVKRNFPNKENQTSHKPWSKENVRKAAIEKWNSLSLVKKKEIISAWAETCLKALVIETPSLSTN